MKILVIGLAIGMMFCNPAEAQKKFYNITLYGGMVPKQTPVQAGLFVNREDPVNEFIFNLSEIEKSYLFGIRKNFRFSYPFFGTLGLEYSRQTENYSILFTHQELPGGNESGLKTTGHVISMPAGVGVKFNNLDVTSGLHLHYQFRSEMKEDKPMGIVMDKPQLEMGWYTGIGYSISRMRIGVQYQSSLSRYGHDLMHKQKPMELRSLPGNVSFSIGFSF